MATEKFKNRAETYLNGAINNSTTSVIVLDATVFPTSGQFRIVVDTEIMIVTGISSNTLTVTRGAESTSAASHTTRTPVVEVITAGALDQFRSDNIMCGTYANLPAAEKAGRLYLPTNSPYKLYDNGSSWVATANGIQCTIPDFSGFTWVNQGSATTSITQGYTFLSDLTTTTNHQLRILKKTAINTTSYTVTAGIIPLIPPFPPDQSYSHVGLVQATSGGNQTITFGVIFKSIGGGTPDDTSNIFLGMEIFKFTNTSTATLFPYYHYLPFPSSKVWWLRMADDGTNRKYQFSMDGTNYGTIYSEARTSFFTPDQYGVFVDAGGSATDLVGSSIVHFKETTP